VISLMGSKPSKGGTLSGLPFYTWEVPGKPISIELHFDVIDRMSPDILRGLGALKRRGAEVGGILLGRIENGPSIKVIVDDFEPVASEYLTGPSYNLSQNDLAAFEAAIARRKSESAGKLAIVGFFRSHTRDELYMDDADLALARRYFAHTGNIFLVIKPFATRPCIGGFFFWEDGEIARASTYQQFPFDRRELGGGAPQSEARPSRSQPDTAPQKDAPAAGEAPVPPYAPAAKPATPFAEDWPARRTSQLSIFSEPETSASPGRARWRWPWLLVPALLAIGGIMAFRVYRDSPNASANQSLPEAVLPLRLSVAERNNQLDITWDRNASTVVRANRGLLSISDGTTKRDLDLSGPQLRNGRVLYSRLSGDVNLRLEVFPEGQASVVESIRVVSTDAQPPVGQPTVTDTTQAQQTRANPARRLPVRRDRIKPAVETPPPAEPEIELPRPGRRR
jgi:hypothetical protein